MTQEVEERTLEIITDNLARGYPQLVVGTFQEASEIMNAMRLEPDPKTSQELRDTYIYTANLSLARIKDGKLEYGLSGRKTFDGIAGQDIEEFSRQLAGGGFYKLSPKQIEALESFAVDIVWVDTSKLNLRSLRYNRQLSFFKVDTSDYFAEKLNDDQRRVAQKIYGSMERKQEQDREYTDFGENMNMLKVARKTTTGIYFSTPNYIKESIKEGEVIAWSCRLLPFGGGSRFGADSWGVSGRGGLRGVRNVEKGDAPKVKIDPIGDAYNTILGANPDQALRAMTPEIATRYLNQ